MKGHLHIHGDVRGNRINTFESQRFLRLLVVEPPNFPRIREDPLFLADNVALPERPTPDRLPGSIGQVLSDDLRRMRRVETKVFLAPASPGQIAFALGRVYAGAPTGINPNGVISEVDVNQNQIGNIFGHPIGREAIFNETAVAPTGVGILSTGGSLSQTVDERGHYIYYIQIVETGDDVSSTYFYQRWPYHIGAYRPGSSLADDADGSGETLNERFYKSTENRSTIILDNLIPSAATFDPASVVYRLDFPTQGSRENNDTVLCSGLAYDGAGQYWWTTTNNLENDDVNASRGRSLWSWAKYSGQMPVRRDADDNYSSTLATTSYPALPTNVQYRDVKSGRNGFVFVAADGLSDDGNGTSETGALIQIDTTNNTVEDVHGTSVTGIYTVSGLRSNDILAITVDQTETRAAAGFDRVWVLHRNGLSFGDMNITTGTISSWSTVADTGATFNNLDANSIRGIQGAQLLSVPQRNSSQATLDHDSNGDVYWVSSQGPGNYTTGINRINRLIGDASTHTYYSLDDSAEGGASGFIQLGGTVTGAIEYACYSLHVHRADTGDPNTDDIYISGAVSSLVTNAYVRQFPISDWGTDNPGKGYYADSTGEGGSLRPATLQVAPDGSFIVVHQGSDTAALMTSLGDYEPPNGGGTGAAFAAAVGNNQTVTLAGGSNFDTRWVGRQVRFTGTTNAANGGSFRVNAVNTATEIVVENPSGVSETSSFNWTIAGDELDGRSSDVAIAATFIDSEFFSSYRIWPKDDNSGQALMVVPRQTLTVSLALYQPFAITYNWSGTEWYRRKRHHYEDGLTRTAHTTAETLDSGVTVTFTDSNSGGDEFVAEEFYTFGVSVGLIKDPTQELRYLYDFYPTETTLIARPADAEGTQNRTASYGSATGGFITPASLATVTTDNPFTGVSTAAGRQLAFPCRQFLLDGSNNTETVEGTGTFSTTEGIQQSLDLGSDTVCSQLRWMVPTDPTNDAPNWTVELYSATNAAGPASWTLRETFTRGADTPAVVYRGSAFRTTAANDTTSSEPYEVIFDLGELDGTGSFGTNTAQRYWKIAFRRSTGSAARTYTFGNMYALNNLGNPVGFTTNQYLNTAPDSNWLANFVIRAVFEIDTGTGSAARGPGNDQVTLTADTFDSNIGVGDFFRVMSGTTILQELEVLSRDSATQLTFTTNAETFSSANWEVVRNADVRPRDDAGGGEDVSQFPPTGPTGVGQVYIDPITGFIYYNDDDVTNSSVLRVERYVKVIRAV